MSSTLAAVQPEPSKFLTVPAEIRELIYREILHPDANRVYYEDEYTHYNYAPALVLFKLNRQIWHESRKIFRDLNVFVRVETPWPEAQDHVALKGHVPILISKDKARKFQDHSLEVGIDAPDHTNPDIETQCFVLLLEDLHKFTRTWFYADLSHPGMNNYLRLNLTLRDPYTPAWEEGRIPKSLQRRLLLPFGEVRNLKDTVICGELKPYRAIVQELRDHQAEPHVSPESCLRESTSLKLAGNEALRAENYQSALKLYNESWLAMHIVIKGRQRHIHADAYFEKILTEEPFVQKNGQQQRLILRVQLVANTCLVYLKLKEYENCVFWGMRTINVVREAVGVDERTMISPEEEAVRGFPAADQMGKIYYRVALALKELGDVSEARRLLKVARIYLPRDENVMREVAATALKLG
ncbi:hypothetical protein TI39_contig41g00007 [Zymoseptoria brevis]|uniref:Uncharacterized protein n=1 Tax=Zymoseptoria brevis TaxID=1047168 RepID=A0A0F4GZV9_9PEZI|nr:hypothetical protein TI39_contig41g00007 [Zymoseptoria brevis]